MTDLLATGTAGWSATLDRLDATIDAAWLAIGGGDLDGVAAALDRLQDPAQLPPLPPALEVRAKAALERLGSLDELLETARREVGRDLEVAQRLAASERPVPRFIDRRW